MSNRGGSGNRGGRGQSQSPGPSTSRSRGGGGVGAGRGRGFPGSPSPSFTQPTPPVPVPVTPPVTESPSSSSGHPHQSVSSGSCSNVGDLSQQMKQQLALEPKPVREPPPSSSKALRVATRPGYGTVGRRCMVKANHFFVHLEQRDLHHYRVSISPKVTSKKLNRDIMTQLIKWYKESLGRRIPVYDGMKSLYTAGALPFESKQFVVKLTETDGHAGSSSGSSRKERKFTVTIELASKPDLYNLQQFLRGRHLVSPQKAIQALNVVLRAPQRENCTVVGRSFFSKDIGCEGELGGGVQYWMGYYQSLRPTQMGLSLCTNISISSFYEPILVSEFVSKHINLRNLSGTLSNQDCKKVRDALRGIKVEFSRREYIRSYKIADISREPLRQITFMDDRGKKISVVQYFLEKYNIGLRFTALPALQVGTDARPIYLPMEVCKIVGEQKYTKRLNARQVTALLRASCKRPRDQENNIREMVRYNEFNRNSVLKEFGIQVGEEPTSVKARVLPPPLLKYHKTGREREVNPTMGQWNMMDKKMVNGGHVDSWTCVNFSSNVDQCLQSEFCSHLVDMCRSKGMEFNPRPTVPMQSFRDSQIEMALTGIHNRARNLQLLIIILPDVTGSYGKIKRICETELGIVSQCCQPRQVSRLNKQYMENVSLKINVKAYGSLEEGYLPPITFILVQKRHNTRLFPLDHHSRDQTDRSGNIKPGTVVDSEICHPTEFDFYLNSHAGIRGTSRPTHYHVLYDENRFTADALQVLTNNLCYTYARCTRAVSIVPPAYYARLAAFRARYYIEGESSDATSFDQSKTTKRTKKVKPLPIIKDNVKDVMFYC